MIEVGIDWAEDHHDVAVLDEQGQLLAGRRIPAGVEGLAWLHAMLAEHAEDPAQVMVGVETDRGLLVGALVAAGYQVYAVNRERSTATVTAMARLAPSPMLVMPGCWLTWSAPIGTSTAGSRATVSLPGRSRFWPAATRA